MLRLGSVCLFFLLSTGAYAAGLSDREKIDTLIDLVASSNITFIRNGEEHDGAWAKQHLQFKLSQLQPPVVTMDDFLTRVASTTTSGKPYKIRFKNGKEVESAVWFREQLAVIESVDGGAPKKPDSKPVERKKFKGQ